MTVMLLQLFTKQPLHKKNKKQMHTNQPTNKTNNKNKEVVVVPGWSLREHLTLQPLRPVPLNHDAELQHQLGRTLQEGLQQAQHVHVCVLEHHGPVPAPLVLPLPPRLDPQVQSSDVPEGSEVDTGSDSSGPGGIADQLNQGVACPQGSKRVWRQEATGS